MPEEATNTAPVQEVDKKAPVSTDQSVERNSVTLPLALYTFLKGDNKDKQYPSITVTSANINDVMSWLGIGDVVDIVQTFIKRTSQQIYMDNIDAATGQLNMQGFLADLKALSSGGMTMKELTTKIEELQGELSAKIQKAIATNTISDPKVAAEIGVTNEQIVSYRAKKDARSRKKDVVDVEPAVAV